MASHCVRTCRDHRPDAPYTWCDGCVEIEAEEREANWQRWQADRDQREPIRLALEWVETTK